MSSLGLVQHFLGCWCSLMCLYLLKRTNDFPAGPSRRQCPALEPTSPLVLNSLGWWAANWILLTWFAFADHSCSAWWLKTICFVCVCVCRVCVCVVCVCVCMCVCVCLRCVCVCMCVCVCLCVCVCVCVYVGVYVAPG